MNFNQICYLLKQAWAGLSVKKGFLLTIVTTLGVTLGALLCILTLADLVIVKPLPYPEQQHLYKLNVNYINAQGERRLSGHDYQSLVNLFDNQTQFSQSALVYYGDAGLSSLATQPNVETTFVTPGWFTMLGTNMALGRAFEETEDKDSYHPVAILSHATWKNLFNSDSEILKQTIRIKGTSYRIIGVLAESFIEPQLFATGVKTDIFLPWDYNPASAKTRDSWTRTSSKRTFVGKLDSPLSLSQVEQSLTTLVNDAWQENVVGSSFYKGGSKEIALQSFKDAILGDSKNSVLLLLAGVIGLVLVACTNITNLFMSRTAEQQRQLSIQAALGARKSHMFQSLFAQSGLVVFISASVGLIIASGGFWSLQHFMTQHLPRVEELGFNVTTLGSALLITLLLGLFFARLSVRIINYRALNNALQSSGKGTGIQVSTTVRQWLIISQVSIVTLLVFINLGVLRDSVKIINQPLGFDPANISVPYLTVNSSNELSMEERASLISEVKNKLLTLPGVIDVSQAMTPFARVIDGRRVPQVIEATQERLTISTRPVDDRYFQMIGQPLLEGDLFSAADIRDGTKSLIINDVYAAKLENEGSALGSQLTLGNTLYTVSGVVKGVQMPTAKDIPMRAYTPISVWPEFLIKLQPQQKLSRKLLVKALQEVSSQIDLSRLDELEEQRHKLLFTTYTSAVTSAVLAVLTFCLAAIGLYGILSYSTQMRRFELGTRMAIGAKRKQLIGLVVKDNAWVILIGMATSVVAMLVLYLIYQEQFSTYLNTELLGIFTLTVFAIGLLSLFACYWPLRQYINRPAIHSLRGSD